jgi:hypothetical protein
MATTGDYIYRKGLAPETRVALSLKNKIFSYIPKPAAGLGEFRQVGVMSTFNVSESRGVEPIRGIGFGDQVAELVPSVTDPMSISVERAMLYVMNLMQAFGYTAGVDGVVRSLKHHKWPFDIKQELVFSVPADLDAEASSPPALQQGSDGINAIITIFEACWLNSYSVSFGADTTQVMESCDITVSDVMHVSGVGSVGSEDTGNYLSSRRFATRG